MQMKQQKKDRYGLKLLMYLVSIFILLASTMFYLMENYYSKSFLDYQLGGKKIYFYSSSTVSSMYQSYNMDYQDYENKIAQFKKICQDDGFNTQTVHMGDLKTLAKGSVLIALDLMALSKDEKDAIDAFVKRGGRILFNFTSGFLDASLRLTDDTLVKRITSLSIDPDVNSLRFDQNNTGYLSTKLLSPITANMEKGQGLDMTLYDPLPIFKTVPGMNVDAYLTNWSQVDYIKIGKNRALKKDQSGLIWHGYYGKGKWVYFSYPSYILLDSNLNTYKKLFEGMLSYLVDDISVVAYPYVDAKNAVFLSEDTEYKFENLQQLYDTAVKNNFPVTAFCVANLAETHKALMEKVAKNPLIEIGSHSYTHGKIMGESDEVIKHETIDSKTKIDSLINGNIIGFRPPREEIDDKMIDDLEKGGFKYILNEGENRLSPYFKDSILIIPRHGTDDYSYLVNLDWNSTQVLDEMKKQVNVVASLDGIFTMSTHTHLMTFGSNIKIVDNFFAYVKSQKEMTPMNGRMLYKRILEKFNLSYTTNISEKKAIVTISNKNDHVVKNMHFEVDVDPDISIIDATSEIIGLKTEIKRIDPTHYTLIVDSLQPRSQTVIFLNYAKND